MKIITKVLLLTVLGVLLMGCGESGKKAAQTNGQKIELTPVQVYEPVRAEEGMKEGQELSGLVFYIKAPWLEKGVELRYPEVIQSSMGFHFVDNYSSSIKQLSPFTPFPLWHAGQRPGQVVYTYTSAEGLTFSGSATPGKSEVLLEYTVVNNSGQDLDFVEINPCFNFRGCPQFNASWDLNNLFAYFDGKLQTMANTTPTPEQVGRQPWLVYYTPVGLGTLELPRDNGLWWRVDQVAEQNIMAAQSRDGEYLVGYAWRSTPRVLMSNCGYPCLHSGPGPRMNLKNGQTHTWVGKVYLIKNDKRELMRRYRQDQHCWSDNKNAPLR